jgi:hypothetical protein
VRKLPTLNSLSLFQLSTAGFLLFSPISILAYPVSLIVVNPKESAISMTLVGFLITAITYFSYLLITRALQTRSVSSIPLRISFFLLTVTITGAFRGFIFYEAGEILGLQQPSDLPKRIFASAFTTIFWLSSANFIINLTRVFRVKYQSTLNQYLTSQMQFAVQNLEKDSQDLELDDFQADLTESLSKLTTDAGGDTFREISERLIFHINDQLRPLSRRIWLRSLSEYPVINYKGLLIDSIRVLRYSKSAFLFIMAFLAILENSFLRGFGESFWRTISYLIVTLLIHILFQKIDVGERGLRVVTLFLLAISAIPIYLSEFFVGLLGYQNNYLAASLITPVPAAVIIILSLLDLTQRDRSFLLELLERSGDSLLSHVAPGVDLTQRHLASYLHNSFQSELLALSGQMAAVAISGDKEETASVLQRVAAVASRSLSDDLSKLNERPLERLASVVSSWKNLLEIRIEISDSFMEAHLNKVVFVQTIEEIASNAFRHDKATSLWISAEQGEVGVRLLFQSDGKEPITKSKGMGDSWLNQVSLTPYSIEKNQIGTLISVEI